MTTNTKTQPKKPCINCVYFKACGETTRTAPCDGRMTKKDYKNNKKGERNAKLR